MNCIPDRIKGYPSNWNDTSVNKNYRDCRMMLFIYLTDIIRDSIIKQGKGDTDPVFELFLKSGT